MKALTDLSCRKAKRRSRAPVGSAAGSAPTLGADQDSKKGPTEVTGESTACQWALPHCREVPAHRSGHLYAITVPLLPLPKLPPGSPGPSVQRQHQDLLGLDWDASPRV